MTTITVEVPDNEVSEVKQLLELSGNVLRAEMLKQAIIALHEKSEIDDAIKRGLTEVEAISAYGLCCHKPSAMLKRLED